MTPIFLAIPSPKNTTFVDIPLSLVAIAMASMKVVEASIRVIGMTMKGFPHTLADLKQTSGVFRSVKYFHSEAARELI